MQKRRMKSPYKIFANHINQQQVQQKRDINKQRLILQKPATFNSFNSIKIFWLIKHAITGNKFCRF